MARVIPQECIDKARDVANDLQLLVAELLDLGYDLSPVTGFQYASRFGDLSQREVVVTGIKQGLEGVLVCGWEVGKNGRLHDPEFRSFYADRITQVVPELWSYLNEFLPAGFAAGAAA